MIRKLLIIIILSLFMQQIFIIPTKIFAGNQLLNESQIEERNSSENQDEALDSQDIHQSSILYSRQLSQWKQQFPSYKPKVTSRFTQSKVMIPVSKVSVTAHQNEIYKLQPKYLTNNFSFSMMASTITDQNTVISKGNFRTRSDLSGMSWEAKDYYSHPELKYPTDGDFSDIILSYTYYLYGDLPEMNSTLAPVLTVETNNGAIYYVRLWNYVRDRPQDDWETGANIKFPADRTPGGATGTIGNIEIDFNNLYAGWQPYIKDSKIITHQDGTTEYIEQWINNKDWKKIPVKDIKRLMWAYVPKEYEITSTTEYLNDSKSFFVKMTNWNVKGNSFLRTEPPSRPLQDLRITDDYDDIYNLTPERVVSDYTKLGFKGYVTMYVGASHYYDKKYVDGAMEVITTHPFNAGFEQWYNNYIQRLKEQNFSLINSISMENVDAPSEWWQRTWDNVPATSGWTPPPHLLSFNNEDVKAFYKSYVNELAQMSISNGMKPIVQLGEPWWWFMEGVNDKPPTFYDKATRDLYKKETGKNMYEFKSSNESIKGHEDLLYWLRDKNGEFSLMLRDELKKNHPDAQFTVLFFTPSVVDKDRVPQMMSIVNFPYKHWKYPNLDFFMLEDYDYLIYDQKQKHINTLTYVQAHLGYPTKLIHYFSGFVSDRGHLQVWDRINQAINDGFNQGFGEVYVWAYAQVKRDGWAMPDMIRSSKPTGLYEKPFDLTFTTTADQIIYTTDGSVPTLNHGTVYSKPITIVNRTEIKAAVVKEGILTQIYNFSYDIGVKQYQYDKFNRLILEKFAQNGKLYIVDYTYDLAGNTIKVDRMQIENN